MEDDTSMVERVGLAALEGLLDRAVIKWELRDLRNHDSDIWDEIVEEAGKAAIQAMREPSEEMLHFGEGYCDFIMPDSFDNSRGGRMQELKLGYQVMMDVANGKHPDKRSSAPGKSGMGEG